MVQLYINSDLFRLLSRENISFSENVAYVLNE